MNWNDLIGKKIVAFRGFPQEKTELTYILFDDNETYIELKEQSPYDYHDCCSEARILELHKNATRWTELLNDYKEPNNLSCLF